MNDLPKKFDAYTVEQKWQSKWDNMEIYRFNWDDKESPVFSIDTPPPYPSGDFHMGNVLNWTYFDIIARYKRMRHFNVLFPQGWDCHGLSIEVQVERMNKIKKTDISPSEFKKLCAQLVDKYIALMKKGILRLGCSVDWKTEYRTMDPDYWRKTQLSFILLYKKGLIYREKHPVNWCTRCETAIADAEVKHEKRGGKLSFIKFILENSRDYLLIATTRPEFIPACVAVAVNPNDERFNGYIGKKIVVPIVNRKVDVIADDNVDEEFGTGVVMICTYGDKDDVKLVMKKKLPVIPLLTINGLINKNGGKYSGLRVNKARTMIIEDLKCVGLIESEERIQHEVGLCERCNTIVEILELEQWFMKNRILTNKVEKMAEEVVWHPDYMKNRLIDWARSLDWDWVISRQRIFGTPIPIWYCKKCSEPYLAKEEWVPIDPKIKSLNEETCLRCGSTEFYPDKDVFDTWMDSSITCAVHAGWPDRKDWKRFFPADLHPSGIDIIRTWAYYLMVRHLALFNEKPYKSCLINGMVLGSDGRKMSKSLKNYVAAPEVLDKYGVDATRQWAAGGGATGSDIPFRWQDVEYGKRFLNKLWNAAKFVNRQLQDYKKNSTYDLQLLDEWLLSLTEKVTKKVTEALDNAHFNIALEEIRNFTWHVLCDQYLEAVKDRLYKPELYSETKRIAVQYTLYKVFYRILQLLAPIAPHMTEELYQAMYFKDKKYKSIHLSKWPIFNQIIINDEKENNGEIIMEIINEIRREKSERHLPLNTQIKKLTIYTENNDITKLILKNKEDITGTCKISKILIAQEKDIEKEIKTTKEIKFKTEY